MATNLQIDDRLLALAQRVGGFRTKKETVNQALADFVKRREQSRVSRLFGTIDLHPDFSPKDLRAKR
ncbi:MAG: type II toxin-antitoxin system VapB family antitoxin [Verrucomicrobiota bacterium]